MARDVPEAFTTAKNAETNAPIWLYRVNISDTPEVTGEDDLFLAEWSEDIEFFKDTNTAQTYTAFPMRHRGISQNAEGQIDTLEVAVANVNRIFQFYLEERDGLRDRKVTIRQVFLSQLADSTAYIEDVFHIDSVSADQQVAVFNLLPRFNLLDIHLPKRRFLRDGCAWRYKGEGCWESDGVGGWQIPSDGSFTADGGSGGGGDLCGKTIAECERHSVPVAGNLIGQFARFGGFLSIPRRNVLSGG